jgi:hypothetical protein
MVKYSVGTGHVILGRKEASSVVKNLVPYKEGHYYVRFRAIGCLEVDGDNQNGDGFPFIWFEDERSGFGFTSFRGKRAFVEHQSDDIRNSIGELPDAYLNRFVLPDGYGKYAEVPREGRHQVFAHPNQADGSIEVLMDIDPVLLNNQAKVGDSLARTRSASLLRMLDQDYPVGCSMGVNVSYSTCSVCGNRARTEKDYCPDVAYSKRGSKLIGANQIRDLLDKNILEPEWIKHILPREGDRKDIFSGVSNRMVLARVFEINHELNFFELSLVANPAYPKGWKLEKIGKSNKNMLKSAKIDFKLVTNDVLLSKFDELE